MRAYSTDLKERLVRSGGVSGQPMREAARRFNVAVDYGETRRGASSAANGLAGAQDRFPAARDALAASRKSSLRARLQAAPDATVLEHECLRGRGHHGPSS